VRGVMSCRITSVLILFLVCLIPASLLAQVRVIGTLNPSTAGNATPGFCGIAFDGNVDPLLLDRLSWGVSRVSLQDASVVWSSAGNPPQYNANAQLTYDPTTGDYYTTEGNDRLVRLAPGNFAVSPVGDGIGAFFNFVALATDPQGQLWLATDMGGGELWTVDKQTGIGTLYTMLHLPVGHQLTSMTIDSAGDFVISAFRNYGGTPSYICQVDPTTGNTSVLSDGPTNPEGVVEAMAYDPLSRGFYGVLEDRSVSPYGDSLVQFTGISLPEPSSIGLLGLFAVIACRRSRLGG
ncbi:MAG: hypothetical protein ACREJM_13140, partial [Candidatus Saccharimonadales bacterium]